MPKRLFLVFTILFFWVAQGNSQISPDTKVALITCGSGDDLYSTFGHSAILFSDPRSGLNKTYNYGTFDFNTPNFYLKFTRGQLEYILNVTTFDRFIASYQREGRWVKADELNLSLEEKEALYLFLENNARPENRSYKYDFFYDNCSTRIRDALEDVLGDKLIFPINPEDSTMTFRNMLDLYLTNHPWSDLGIDLALGLPCDMNASWKEKMFLPDYLKSHLGEASIVHNAETIPLFGEETLILDERVNSSQSTSSITWIFWIVFGLAALSALFLKGKIWRWFDFVLFSSVGILGVMIFLLWFATDHSATKWNLNILWALPSWIYGAYLVLKGKVASSFFKVHAMIMLALVVFWMLIPQNFHSAVVPIILALGARAWASQKVRFQNKTVEP